MEDVSGMARDWPLLKQRGDFSIWDSWGGHQIHRLTRAKAQVCRPPENHYNQEWLPGSRRNPLLSLAPHVDPDQILKPIYLDIWCDESKGTPQGMQSEYLKQLPWKPNSDSWSLPPPLEPFTLCPCFQALNDSVRSLLGQVTLFPLASLFFFFSQYLVYLE